MQNWWTQRSWRLAFDYTPMANTVMQGEVQEVSTLSATHFMK